jgi:hypothetical protein
MPFVYGVDAGPATPYTTHATPNTEDPTIVLRNPATTRGFSLQAIFVLGRAAAATTISGIGYRVRRWTTVGSGGTTVTPAPRQLSGAGAATAAVNTANDKATAITAGTVSGAYQVGFGCGKAGPGGWVARDQDSVITVEGNSGDELDINSVAGEASLLHAVSCEFSE